MFGFVKEKVVTEELEPAVLDDVKSKKSKAEKKSAKKPEKGVFEVDPNRQVYKMHLSRITRNHNPRSEFTVLHQEPWNLKLVDPDDMDHSAIHLAIDIDDDDGVPANTRQFVELMLEHENDDEESEGKSIVSLAMDILERGQLAPCGVQIQNPKSGQDAQRVASVYGGRRTLAIAFAHAWTRVQAADEKIDEKKIFPPVLRVHKESVTDEEAIDLAIRENTLRLDFDEWTLAKICNGVVSSKLPVLDENGEPKMKNGKPILKKVGLDKAAEILATKGIRIGSGKLRYVAALDLATPEQKEKVVKGKYGKFWKTRLAKEILGETADPIPTPGNPKRRAMTLKEIEELVDEYKEEFISPKIWEFVSKIMKISVKEVKKESDLRIKTKKSKKDEAEDEDFDADLDNDSDLDEIVNGDETVDDLVQNALEDGDDDFDPDEIGEIDLD